MRALFSIAMSIAILSACSATEELEKYDLYGTVISVEGNIIILDTSSWSHERGDIPEEQEFGTSHDIEVDEETDIIYENGDRGDFKNIHEKQKLGILQSESGVPETVTILNPE